MNVFKAQVVQGRGCDKVLLITDLPNPTYPYARTLAVKFDAAADTGPDYVRKHFGIEPEIIRATKR